MSTFGTIITGRAVRLAAVATIRRWFPTYLAEVARQAEWDQGTLPDFRSYVGSVDLDRFNEDQVPSCVVVSPGLADIPIRQGDGKYLAPWTLNVGCVVSGQDRDNTLELAELYVAAVRTLLVQHRSLEGFAEGLRWVGESYDELDVDDSRTLCAGVVQTVVDVRGVVDSSQGPTVPPVDPAAVPGDWPNVETVSVTIEQRSI